MAPYSYSYWITLVHQICKKPSLSTRYARNLTLLEVYPKYFFVFEIFFSFFSGLFLFFIGPTVWHVGSQFLSHGSNPYPLHWKHRILITELPGKSPAFEIFTKHFSNSSKQRLTLSYKILYKLLLKFFLYYCTFSCLPPLITPSRPRLRHSDCSGHFHSSPTAPLTSRSSVLILIQCQLSSVLSCPLQYP